MEKDETSPHPSMLQEILSIKHMWTNSIGLTTNFPKALVPNIISLNCIKRLRSLLMLLHSGMAATSSYMACAKFSMLGYSGRRKQLRSRRDFTIRAQQQPGEVQEPQEMKVQEPEVKRGKGEPKGTVPRPVAAQLNVQSKNMGREYGGDWLSSATRHVRIYAAYIDPETCAFDQTQMDKLTIILDPTNEFVWTPETTNKVYSYFQELVDHYEVNLFMIIFAH